MERSSESEFLTALATANASASSNPSSPNFSARSESMMVSRESGSCSSSVDEKIEQSKQHWSQLTDFDSDSIEDAAADNEEMFEKLQSHPTWGWFFRTFGDGGISDSGKLEVGEKFAEGGQAELFHAHVTWNDPKNNEMDLEYGYEYVLKVFKKGTLLRNLQSQWPHGYLRFYVERRERTKLGIIQPPFYHCDVYCGVLLEDGRFAFLLKREDEDLRSLIDRNMLGSGRGCGPFQKEVAEWYMYGVALGMDWLHGCNIIHRDLKASNVLVRKNANVDHLCFVADYECSVGVIGTGFWRAPEILQACRDGDINGKQELFTRGVDAYAYGMTCYEILTGKYPFEGHPLSDNRPSLTNLVINQDLRPKVPDFVDDWVHDLLRRCWQSDPTDRPSFEEILSFLEANSISAIIKYMKTERRKENEVQILATEVRSKSE